MNFYAVGPIDFWAGWTSLDEYNDARKLEEYPPLGFRGGASITSGILLGWLLLGWEGDGTPRVTVLPEPDSCDSVPLFAVKQSNNGATFIASTIALPWLENADRSNVITSDDVKAIRRAYASHVAAIAVSK